MRRLYIFFFPHGSVSSYMHLKHIKNLRNYSFRLLLVFLFALIMHTKILLQSLRSPFAEDLALSKDWADSWLSDAAFAAQEAGHVTDALFACPRWQSTPPGAFFQVD